jgi:hypothetical protein
MLKTLLKVLSERFGRHVDVEFTADILPNYPEPEFRLHLLQCRPQSKQRPAASISIPAAVTEAEILFRSEHLVPQGWVQRIQYIVFVDPVRYAQIPEDATRLQIARVIGKLNQQLDEKSFILMGPGRWGSANIELGVKVTYADIYNTAMLIEIGLSDGDSAPEVSYGTHFFQDLVEAEIYPLALYPDEADAVLNWQFLRQSSNALDELLPDLADYAGYVRVIDVPAAARGRMLEVIMDADEGLALGYLRHYHTGKDKLKPPAAGARAGQPILR